MFLNFHHLGRRLDAASVNLTPTFGSASFSDGIVSQPSAGILNCKVEIRGGRALFYLYRTNFTSLGWYRITLIQVHPSEVTPKVGCSNVIQVKERQASRCPLDDACFSATRKQAIKRLHTSNMPLKKFTFGEGENCFEILGNDMSGNNSWSNLGKLYSIINYIFFFLEILFFSKALFPRQIYN